MITYIATCVRSLTDIDSAMLVRGNDAHGSFQPEPRPAADFAPSAVAAHGRAMALRNRNFFGNPDRQTALRAIMTKSAPVETVKKP